jgi:hypothetical protein
MVCRKMIQAEGPKCLFRGLGPIMLRAFPGNLKLMIENLYKSMMMMMSLANAACFLGFELAMKTLNKLHL